ncbi:MAG: alkaline phosphatase family protein [Myxococcota bacterium]
MRTLQRRDFLKALGASVAAGCKSPAPTGDSDTDPVILPPGIDHVVFVMMENRSFDHYFGSLSLDEGRTDVEGLTAGLQNESPQGVHVPYPLAGDWCPPDPPHGWGSCHDQFANGTNAGFAAEYEQRHGDSVDAGLIMGYATRATLPVMYALADHYTLCDRWHCALLGPTWPNRLYAHGTQSQGATSNDLQGGQFTMRTIWDQLEEAGVDWGYFYSDLPFIGLFEAAGPWVENGRVSEIDAFYDACEAGTLPAVSWIEPAFSFNDDHPPHHPLLGQMFLATIHNALASSPQWSRTLLIITYDEHGGFYDHVPPPTTDDDRASDGFDQLGFRVPALICGPWVKPGFIDHTQYSHSSWIRHVQALHGFEPLTARNAAANDLSNALDLERAEPLAPAELPVIAMTADEVLESCSLDRSANQPELEDFVRRHCPELDLRGQDLLRKHIAWAERFGACVID